MGSSTLPRRLAARVLPPAARQAVVEVLYAGRSVACPLCGGRFRAFRPYGDPPEPNRACPRCGSLRRHRLLWLYLEGVLTDLDQGVGRDPARPRRVLHVAPEGATILGLDAIPDLFPVAVDLSATRLAGASGPAVRTDLTALAFGGASFDLIICSHVLEHIPDDHAAMAELCRVLAPTGIALVVVPMRLASPRTLEDPTVTTAADRRRRYGHRDHVRYYGRDVEDRLRSAGFAVEPVDVVAEIGPARAREVAANTAEPIFVCRRGDEPPPC